MVEKFKLNTMRKSDTKLYDLQDFKPRMVNRAYFTELKIGTTPADEVVSELQQGSSTFIQKYAKRSLIPEPSCELKNISFDEPLKSHRYTSRCPLDILEIDPMVGCNVNCMYCLVTDGNHSSQKTVYKNYGSYLRQKLEEENGTAHVYYIAPKTEPFQEATLQTGVAHDIFREFIGYFKKNPGSKSRVLSSLRPGKRNFDIKTMVIPFLI